MDNTENTNISNENDDELKRKEEFLDLEDEPATMVLTNTIVLPRPGEIAAKYSSAENGSEETKAAEGTTEVSATADAAAESNSTDESTAASDTTEVATETSTDESTETSTEASTEATAEVSTEATAEVSTEATTETSTEASTDAATEGATEDSAAEAVSEEASAQDVMSVTANMWKYQPIPENEPEPFPEYVTKYEKVGDTEIIGARVRGKKHKHEGTNGDDWFESVVMDNITCIAVSDGAGSKKYSRIGARCACKAAVGYLKEALTELVNSDADIMNAISLKIDDPKCIEAYTKIASVVQQSMVTAYNSVEGAYYQRNTDKAYSDVLGREIGLKDFSATLLVAVCISAGSEEKETTVISCQIGDGMIALIDSKGAFEKSVKLMGEADSGDFSGETDFLVNKKLLEPGSLASRTKISRGTSDVIMLMSDGVADDYFPNETEMRRLFFDMIANGILEGIVETSESDLSADQVEDIKNIPEPTEFPWVNDKDVMVGLNYTKDILSAMGMTLEDLWAKKYIASLAAAKVKEAMQTDDLSERLKIWLDNYVERGSFDDRTLVVAKI